MLADAVSAGAALAAGSCGSEGTDWDMLTFYRAAPVEVRRGRWLARAV